MVNRHTYVVTVREPDGHTTVKDVRSGKTASLGSAVEAGDQISRWLREERDREDRVSDRP
jgi:hypothetical protein